MWEQYFPCAKVFGWDWNPKQPPAGSTRTHVEQVGQLQLASLEAHSASKRFDLVIDDGAHTTLSFRNSLAALWPRINAGGYYTAETCTRSCMAGAARGSGAITRRTHGP